MRCAFALLALATLAACHRPRADQPSQGADGKAQARTAAKTLADLQAADEASRGPAPVIAPTRIAPAMQQQRRVAEPEDEGSGTLSDVNDAAE